MSSSTRGRKRNDNLPPSRARDNQRAFRARRAAHLSALEQRIAELEEENNNFRAALNLPPVSRPPLGKGPTGKDRPKAQASSRQSDPPQDLAHAPSGSSDSSNHAIPHPLSPPTVQPPVHQPSPQAAPMNVIPGGPPSGYATHPSYYQPQHMNHA